MRITRIMKKDEDNCSNVSPSVSSSSNIPVAISPRGWKVILLGSARPVPCAKRCMMCSSWMYEAVLSKIPLQLLHLRAKDCSSCRSNAASVDLLRVVMTQTEWSNQHWRCAHIVYQFRKFRKFWLYATNLDSSHSVAIMIICKDIRLSSAILQKNFQRCCEENDQIK